MVFLLRRNRMAAWMLCPGCPKASTDLLGFPAFYLLYWLTIPHSLCLTCMTLLPTTKIFLPNFPSIYVLVPRRL